MKGKILSATIIALLLVGTFAALANANPYPPPPDMYMVPETNNFTTATQSIGYKWNITVWLNMDVPIYSWQCKVIFNGAWLRCNKAGYAGVGGADATKSEYFTGLNTVPVTAVIGSNYVLHGESLQGDFTAPAADKRLMWFEMEITNVPGKYETLTSAFDITNADTYVLDSNLNTVPFTPHNGAASYLWTMPAKPYMGFEPTSYLSDKYDELPTQFDKEVLVKGYDAAWGLSSISCVVHYNVDTTHAGLLAVVSVTGGAGWTVFNADTSVADQITITASGPVAPFPSGNVLVATITFDITYKGTYPEVNTCKVTYSDIALFDTVAEIPTTAPEEETDTVQGLQTLEPYYLSVEPPNQTFGPEPVVGTEFDVKVDINNLDNHWKLIGVQFRLDYDTLLVEPVSVTEGDYLLGFADYGTFFVSYFETLPQPHVLVGQLILPNDTGYWNPPFPGELTPTGHGTIATIRFRIIKQIWPVTMVGDFHLWDELAIDPDTNVIPNDPSVDGTVTIVTTPLPGRVIDVFTQYPAPFGGQGPDMPSDMFWPQKEVWLYANVTYNWWPMQRKLVGFEVEDPNGAVWAKLSNVTDVNGQAWVKFRLPWPCDNPESLFGVWHITATVDVACIVINDTLDFHYDYQARLWKVTIDPPPCGNDMNFAHCDTVTLHIEYGTHSQQLIPALISVVLYDEVGVPVAFNFAELTIGGTVFCQYKNGTVTISVHIPKFAVAGVATFHINIYDKDPTIGGIPYCPEYTPAPTIFITPY